jgi:magnesium transporter
MCNPACQPCGTIEVLTIYSPLSDMPTVWQPGMALPAGSIWLELRDPSDSERAFTEQALGSPLPTRTQIGGIELSSRVQAQEEALHLNVPAFTRADGGQGAMTPLGFVLTPKLLVSQRYADSQAFDLMKLRASEGNCPQTSSDAFVELIDTLVDVSATRMEKIAAELSQLSRNVFTDNRQHKNFLRGALFQIGRMQRVITQVRATLLGFIRIVRFVHDSPVSWVAESRYAHLKTVLDDLQSLSEFDQQTSDRLQFLLDAVLGFISIAQNDVMTVLTVVSVVTIPPMILAGIWGMNFKSIGEYNWVHGYAFGLTMIVLSMLVPLLIFKWKKWF